MKLKMSLLYMILENNLGDNRYSKAYQCLKNVIKLEEKDEFKFDSSFKEDFNLISKKYNSFISKIPLIVVERYFAEHKSNPNKYVNLEYNENEIEELQIMDLFQLLEEFYNDIYSLACIIANYYNLEVKVNNSKINETFA